MNKEFYFTLLRRFRGLSFRFIFFKTTLLPSLSRPLLLLLLLLLFLHWMNVSFVSFILNLNKFNLNKLYVYDYLARELSVLYLVPFNLDNLQKVAILRTGLYSSLITWPHWHLKCVNWTVLIIADTDSYVVGQKKRRWRSRSPSYSHPPGILLISTLKMGIHIISRK